MKFIDINYFNELKTDSDIINYVKNRLNYLERKSKTEQISVFTGIKSEYITKDSGLFASLVFSKPFYLDDFNLYVKFIKYLKQFNKVKTSENIIDLDIFTTLCSMFVLELFYDNSKKKVDRHDLYELNGKLSISNFYKNGSAKCFEKSAVMHNLFCLLGIPSHLIIGRCGNINEETGLHAYNIISDPKNNLWLMDFHNFIKVANKNDKKMNVPTLMKLNTKNIDNLDKIIVDSKSVANAYTNYNFKKNLDEKSRIYIMPQSSLGSIVKRV